MNTPPDLIKPTPPAQGGANAARGAEDAVRKADAGTDFAATMRAVGGPTPPAGEPVAGKASARNAAREPRRADPDDASGDTRDSGTPQDAAALQAMLPVPAALQGVPTSPATGAVPVAATGPVAERAGLHAGEPNRVAGAPGDPPAGTGVAPAPSLATPALVPAAVALAVERAIGSAILSRPASDSVRMPADPARLTADPAKIASAGFVAATLTLPAIDARPPAVASEAESPGSTDNGAAMPTSPWLNLRPDALALTLADAALARDPAAVAPARIGQMLEALDRQLGTLAATDGPPIGRAPASAADGTTALAAGSAPGAAQMLPPAGRADNPVGLTVQAPMQQAERWATELGDRLAWVANNRFSAATLQVNPPQLGPIEVRILLSGDQAAVSFAAVQAQTRDAIQQALPSLAASFAGQGLTLGQTSVGSHTPQQQQQGGDGGKLGGQGQAGVMLAGVAAASTAVGGASRNGEGLVDTFA